MPKTVDYLKIVGRLSSELEKYNIQPILVGGMALVILGSQRVTQDFDFVISSQFSLEKLIDVFYRNGFELVSKMKRGRVLSTIDNQNIAKIRIQLDEPKSIFFYHPKIELKIDLLIDFPFLATEIAQKATQVKAESYTFWVASKNDLIRLKKEAIKDRNLSTDIQDLEFLKKLK